MKGQSAIAVWSLCSSGDAAARADIEDLGCEAQFNELFFGAVSGVAACYNGDLAVRSLGDLPQCRIDLFKVRVEVCA